MPKPKRVKFFDVAKGYAILVLLFGHMYRAFYKFAYVEEGFGWATDGIGGGFELLGRALRNHVTLIFFFITGFLIGQKVLKTDGCDRKNVRLSLAKRGAVLILLDIFVTNLGLQFSAFGNFTYSSFHFGPLAFIGMTCIFYSLFWNISSRAQIIVALAGMVIVEYLQVDRSLFSRGFSTWLRMIFFDAGPLGHSFIFFFPFFGWFPAVVAGHVLAKRASPDPSALSPTFIRGSIVAFVLFLPAHFLYMYFTPDVRSNFSTLSKVLFLRRYPPAVDWLLLNFSICLATLTVFCRLGQKSRAIEVVAEVGRNSLFVFLLQPFIVGVIRLILSHFVVVPLDSRVLAASCWLPLAAVCVFLSSTYGSIKNRHRDFFIFRYI